MPPKATQYWGVPTEPDSLVEERVHLQFSSMASVDKEAGKLLQEEGA